MRTPTALVTTPKRTQLKQFSTLVVALLGVISIILALTASFSLANWAEASSLHHGLQHVLLFTAGLGAGSAITLGLKQRKDR